MSDSKDAVEILHTMRAQSNSDRNPATATSVARRTKRPHKPFSESPDTEPSAQKKPRPSKASKESSKPKQVSQASEIKKLRKNIVFLEKTGELMQAQLDEKEEEIKVLKKKVKHQASLLKEGSELVLQKDLKRANDKILPWKVGLRPLWRVKKPPMLPEFNINAISLLSSESSPR